MTIYTEHTHGLYTVYLIINNINNKRYIGIHKEKPNESLRAYLGSGTAIKKAIKKYGVENFTKIILARFDNREETMAMEEQLVTEDIVESTEYYNRMTGGGSGIPSKETLEKKSESMKGKYVGENHPNYGKPISKEQKAKQSAAAKGKNNSQAKPANIYDSKTDRLIAEGVVAEEWCRENGYDRSALLKTARGDRTQPHHWKHNPHQHKGIYARYLPLP